MKIALITDTHFGMRNDDQVFAEYINDFYEKQFFPYLLKHNITKVIHLGDVMDRRKYVSYLTAKQFRTKFIELFVKHGITLDIIIGNHDTYFKHTNSLNSMEELVGYQYGDIRLFPECSCTHTFSTDIAYVPWINEENQQKTFEMLEKTKAKLVFGHLELQGFGMYKGVNNVHGMSPDIFKKFDMVFSGHFHHKSSKGNINYLGAPYEITWSDYEDPRGFHVFDTETYHFEHIINTDRMFFKLNYDDTKIKPEDVPKMDFAKFNKKHVKVIVSEKNNPYLFDMIIEKIEKSGVAEMQVVDDHKHLDLTEEEDIVDQSSDTLSIMNSYVENRKEINEPTRVKKIISDLYREAIDK